MLDEPENRTHVEINGNSPHGEWLAGQIGYVDGYCRGGDDRPYAVVVLFETSRIVMVPLNLLKAY